MVQFVKKNNSGFTLIEILVALVISLLVFFAMMQAALVSIDSNIRNSLRNEAVEIATIKINEALNKPFATLTAGTSTETLTKSFNNIQNFQYTVTRTITDLSSDYKQINIMVRWEWKERKVSSGNPYTYSMTTLRKST